MEVCPDEEVGSVVAYDVVVLGSTVYAGVRLGNVHMFDYYRRALRTIVEEGLLLSLLRRTSTTYLTRARPHLDPRSNTYSERLLGCWANRRSPVGNQMTPQAEASDQEEAAARG